MDALFVFDDMKDALIRALQAEQIQGEAFLASIVQHSITQSLHDAFGSPKQVIWSKASRCIVLGVHETMGLDGVRVADVVQGLIHGIVGVGEYTPLVTASVARTTARTLAEISSEWSFDIRRSILIGVRRAARDLGVDISATLEAGDRGLIDAGVYSEFVIPDHWCEDESNQRLFA